MIGHKITNRITKVSKTSETVTNEHDKEISEERYVSPELRQEVIDKIPKEIYRSLNEKQRIVDNLRQIIIL